MNDTLLRRAYVAGLFDGEGTCFAYAHNRSHEVRIQIGLTTPALLDDVFLDLGFGRIFHEKRLPPKRDCYFLRFNTKPEKLAFIDYIEPFVRLKKRQLVAARRLLSVQRDYTGGHKMSVHEIAIREDCWRELRKLNQRGAHEVERGERNRRRTPSGDTALPTGIIEA